MANQNAERRLGECERSFDTLQRGRVRACWSDGLPRGGWESLNSWSSRKEIRRAIVARSDASTLRAAAREQGMRSLKEDGWLKIASGQTTVEEVLRVTQEV